jgi:four helix bundle protein
MRNEHGTENREQRTENWRKGDDIAGRLMKVAVEAVRVARALPKDIGGRHVALQLIRSSTSAGANYEEARAAESRNDFIHKVAVAGKEIREAGYWLRLIQLAAISPSSLEPLAQEVDELTAILIASRRTATRNAD